MTDDDHPRIVGVELLPGSLAVWRALNGESANMYPVLLRLSRPLDLFEQQALRTVAGYVPSDTDASTVVLPVSTLEAVRLNFDSISGIILNKTAQGRLARDAAYAEDDRLHALEAEINEALGRPDN
jgi:hypothetical protein